jgi:hypothetical protein
LAADQANESLAMKTYRGTRGIDALEVWADAQPLDECTELKRLSKNGFEWTYEGKGPAQLALAILADCLDNDEKALANYEAFMIEIVANLDNDWELTGEQIMATVAALEGAEA